MLRDQHIAIIGAGAMGEAIISGLLHQQVVLPEQIVAAEPRADRRHALIERYAIAASENLSDVAQQGTIVLLAVKPQALSDVLPPIREVLRHDALCLSIIAGIPIHTFVNSLAHSAVVRAMPNTPAQIGEGMTVWTATPAVSEQQRTWAQTVLRALGHERFVEEERYLDMATAINGSGPAYIFLILEAMIDAGVHMGFSRPIATELVYQTMLGSVRYAMQSDRHLAELRNAVTSPGGTTAAALNALFRGGLPTVLSDAMWAAYQRARELGRSE